MASKNLALGLSCHLFVQLSTLRLLQDQSNVQYEQAWWAIITSIPSLEKFWDKIYQISMEEIAFADNEGLAHYLSEELPDIKKLIRRQILINILYSIWILLREDTKLKSFLTNGLTQNISPDGDEVGTPPYKSGYPSHYVPVSHMTRHPQLRPSDKTTSEEVSENPSDKPWTPFIPTGLLAENDPRHPRYIDE